VADSDLWIGAADLLPRKLVATFKDREGSPKLQAEFSNWNLAPTLDDKIFKALTRRGLRIPKALVDLKVGNAIVKGSNLNKDARYDQILHMPTLASRFTDKGGTLDFSGSPAFIKTLFPKENYSTLDFTFQLSDHFPVWVQIDTDIEGQRLSQIVQDGQT